MPILANVIQSAFSPLISLFESILVFIHNHLVGGSWGLAIVGLTVFIRAVLVPVTYRQLKAMQEMQRLAPEMNALKAKYKDDKQRQQQELMKFYRENKVNPLASCLPFALQIPVFISLFYMLRSDLKKHICGPQMVQHYNAAHHTMLTKVAQLPAKYVEKTDCNAVAPHSAKFLFLPDITSKATGVALVVLIVLYVASQVGSTLIATATADPNQRRLMLFLPIVFVAILFRYPAGLLVYWVTTNLWTIGQQLVIKRRIGSPSPAAKGAAKGAAQESANGKSGRALKPALAGAGVAHAGASSAAVDGSPEDGVAAPDRASSGAGASTPTRGTDGSAARASGAPPPRPPRKKKKRSGRRR